MWKIAHQGSTWIQFFYIMNWLNAKCLHWVVHVCCSINCTIDWMIIITPFLFLLKNTENQLITLISTEYEDDFYKRQPTINMPQCSSPSCHGCSPSSNMWPPSQFLSLTQQFCAQLSPWQCPLFGPISKIQPTPKLLRLCQTHTPVLLVSNASVQKNHHSDFAWIIATNEKTLWRGVGLALDQAKDMFWGQAEAIWLLAALLFLQHYIFSYGPQHFEAASIQCFCDNLGIIMMINEMITTMILRPNDMTNDDCDIYLVIIAASKWNDSFRKYSTFTSVHLRYNILHEIT